MIYSKFYLVAVILFSYFMGSYCTIRPLLQAFPELRKNLAQQVHDAVALMYNLEHIQFDTTYAGGAAAALLYDLTHDESLAQRTIVLWKTYADGAYQETTESIDYKNLPPMLHSYFELPLQPLDNQGY